MLFYHSICSVWIQINCFSVKLFSCTFWVITIKILKFRTPTKMLYLSLSLNNMVLHYANASKWCRNNNKQCKQLSDCSSRNSAIWFCPQIAAYEPRPQQNYLFSSHLCSVMILNIWTQTWCSVITVKITKWHIQAINQVFIKKSRIISKKNIGVSNTFLDKI